MRMQIGKAQLRWAAQIVRTANDRLLKHLFYCELEKGKRPVGEHKKIYKSNLKLRFKSCDIPEGSEENIALDRPR